MADSTISHRKSPVLAPSSYHILKLAERDTTVSVFVGCTIPSLHRFRKKMVTCLCENGPVISTRILCDNTHTCIHECTHMYTVQIPTLLCYSTVVVVKNMLNAEVQADQTDVGSG